MNNTRSRPHFQSNKFALDKGKNLSKAVKTLYPIGHSLSLEKCFFMIVLVPVALKSKKQQQQQQQKTASILLYQLVLAREKK